MTKFVHKSQSVFLSSCSSCHFYKLLGNFKGAASCLSTLALKSSAYIFQVRRLPSVLIFHILKVIPQYYIAHLYCARFSRHQRAHMSACSCKTWRICLDIELCQLKNGYSAPTSMGTPTVFLVIVINLS